MLTNRRVAFTLRVALMKEHGLVCELKRGNGTSLHRFCVIGVLAELPGFWQAGRGEEAG